MADPPSFRSDCKPPCNSPTSGKLNLQRLQQPGCILHQGHQPDVYPLAISPSLTSLTHPSLQDRQCGIAPSRGPHLLRTHAAVAAALQEAAQRGEEGQRTNRQRGESFTDGSSGDRRSGGTTPSKVQVEWPKVEQLEHQCIDEVVDWK